MAENHGNQGLRKCSRCGGTLRSGLYAGLCPRCVLRSALTIEQPPSGDTLHFAGYDLLEKVGEGGMGVVYKARQTGGFGHTVALKRIRDGEFAEPAMRKRFMGEMRTIADLHHPHIVPILEVGEYEQEPYFTMVFMPGGNLAQRTGEYAEPRAAASLMAMIARAAHAGHQRRVLHRDLKPANILFDAEDQPYLADFGLAKNLDNGGQMTTTGVVLGTAYYMAPERVRAQENRDTVAADIWSLGVMLYELIAGQRPFLGRTSFEVMRRVVETEPPPIEKLRPDIPRELTYIYRKCLEKEPAARYLLAKTLAEDLERFVRTNPA